MTKMFRIFNIFLMAAAAFAIVCFLMFPTLDLSINYKLTPEQLTEIMKEEKSSSSNSESSASEESFDFAKVLGEDGLTLDLALSVQPKLLFRSLSEDTSKVIEEEFVDPNVTNIIKSIKSPLYAFGKNTLMAMVAKFYGSFFEQEIDLMKGESETRTAKEIRIAGGITDDYCLTMSRSVMDKLVGGNSTVNEANDALFDSFKNATNKFNEAGTGYTLPFPDDDKKSSMLDATKEMLNSIGMIKPDGESLYPIETVMEALIVKSLRQSNNEAEPEGETTEEAAAQLDPQLTKIVKGVLPADSIQAIKLVLNILCYVIIAFIATWSVFLIYTLCRTLFSKKRPYTFTGPIFWILGAIQIILGVTLTLAVTVMLTGDTLTTMMGGGSAEAAKMLANFKVSIMTCAFYPSIILLVMIPTMIVYSVQKHKYKKQLKAEASAPAAQ